MNQISSQNNCTQKIGFKDYMARQLIGKRLHFICECLMPFDIESGKIIDYELKNNEIIFLVDTDKKIIKIGENHPKLYVEN